MKEEEKKRMLNLLPYELREAYRQGMKQPSQTAQPDSSHSLCEETISKSGPPPEEL